jgi:hypothetical protein
VTERLLDDDARTARQDVRGREAIDDNREQRGRDLEVVDGGVHQRDRFRDRRVRLAVGEVAGDVAQPSREALEHGLVDLLAALGDRPPRVIT